MLKENIIFAEKPNIHNFRDLETKIFGRLTVLGYAGKFGNGKKKHSYWWVECNCLNKTIKTVLSSNLTTNKILSCGCYRSEKVRKYSINLENFLNINDPEIAYIYGLWWADGYLGGDKKRYFVDLHIHKKDAETFISILKKFGTWGIHLYKNSVHIRTYSQELGEHLNNLGYVQKSIISPENVLNFIPDNLKHYWLRGYFDGDGCVMNRNNKYLNVRFCGGYEQSFNGITDILKNLDIKFSLHRKKKFIKLKNIYHSSSELSLSNSPSIIRLFEYMYKGKQFGLERKRNIFDEILKNFNPQTYRLFEYNNKNKTIKEWAEYIGESQSFINGRLKNGWTLKETLEIPKGKKRNYGQ